MIKGIVFDLDHTLFDRYKTFEEISYKLFEDYKDNLLVGREKFYEIMCEADMKKNHYGWKEEDAYARESGIFKEIPKPMSYAEALTGYFHSFAVKYDFVDELLIKLRKKYAVALITNGPSDRQRAKLRLLGFEDKFDFIYISGEHGIHKPEVYPFEYTAKKLGISPSELLYVGDHPVNDVDASRRAGYTPVWVKTIPEWQFDELARAEYEVDSVKSLPEILKKLSD